MSRQVLPPDQQERRRSVLSDQDLESIGTAFDKRLNAMFEVIGYDTTTADTRMEIRKDHEFVRDARRAKGRVIAAFLASVGAGLALLLWSGFKHS